MTNLAPMTPSNPTEEAVIAHEDTLIGHVENRGGIWYAIVSEGEFLFPTREEAIQGVWDIYVEEGNL